MEKIWRYELRIEEKKHFIWWIGHDPTLPKGILHALEIEGLEEGLKHEKISLALVALPNPKYQIRGYTFCFESNLSLRCDREEAKFDDNLKKRGNGMYCYPAFSVNIPEITREQEFRHNKVYESYGLYLFGPSPNLQDFLNKHQYLAPYATPDSAP